MAKKTIGYRVDICTECAGGKPDFLSQRVDAAEEIEAEALETLPKRTAPIATVPT